MAQTLNEIKNLLAAHGLRPKNRLGQNFLHDGNQMQRIVEAARIRDGDVVLEVGAGTGALTSRLLDEGTHVVAVEIDDDLRPILRQQFESYGDLFTLVAGDVLAGKHAINPAVTDALVGRPFTMVANLPYHVASPLLVNLCVEVPTMRSAVVMVQREVADRLTAGPNAGADFGPLSVMVQAMCTVDRLFVVPPGCFWPAPKIDSAAVRLDRRDTPLTDDPAALSATCQRLFQQRRKQLGAILGRDLTLPHGVDRTMRPQELTVEQIVALSRVV